MPAWQIDVFCHSKNGNFGVISEKINIYQFAN